MRGRESWRSIGKMPNTKMRVGDATEILVSIAFSHVLRAGTVGEQGRDNRAADLLHLVALR